MIKHFAKRLCSTVGMSETEWLAVRQQGIGGSDISAICGINPWKSPVECYLEKTKTKIVPEQNELMHWGHMLEPVVTDEFARRHPEYKVERLNAILQHHKYDTHLANIDRMIECDEGSGVLEVKTAGQFAFAKWEGGIPLQYQAQVQWYLHVTGLNFAWIAVLVGGQQYFEYKIYRDDAAIDTMVNTADRFWQNYVVPMEMPAASVAEDLDPIKDLFRTEEAGTVIAIDGVLSDLIGEYENVKATIKESETQKDALEARIKQLIGTAEKGDGSGWSLTWKCNKASLKLNTKSLEIDHPEIVTAYSELSPGARVLRIKKAA